MFKKWLKFRENQDNYGYTDPQVNMAIAKINAMYPLAGAMVDGRKVRPEIPNMSSIQSSLDDYHVLNGIRDFPIQGFAGARSYYSASDQAKVYELAKQIAYSKEINPLIIVEESQGPYVLEGGHRMSALVELGARSAPALIVIDLDSFPGN